MNQKTLLDRSDASWFIAFPFSKPDGRDAKPKSSCWSKVSSESSSSPTNYPDFSALPFDILTKIAAPFNFPNLLAASLVCRSWGDALRALREAMVLLRQGKQFKHGRGGVGRNLEKALVSFLKGSARGSTLAMVDAGLVYWERGQKEEAIALYQKAAALGDAAGQCNLGISYLHAQPQNHKETLGVNSVHDGGFSDPLELRLSLSLGVAKGKKEDKQRSRCDKKTNTFSRIVIDLEESTERTSDEDAKNSPFDFAAKVTYSGGKHDSQVAINSNPITSGCMKKDLSYKIAETSSFVGDRNYQDWSDSDQGLKCHRNMLHKNLLTRKQQFTSCGMGNVDLNEVQLDDLSCESDDAIVVNPLMTSSSCGFSGLVSKNHEAMCPIILWGKEIKEFPNGTSEMIQQEDGVKLDLINSNNKDRRTEVQVRNSEHCGRNECGISLNNPASESSPRINMPEDRCSHGGITKKGRDELILKLQNGSAHGLNPACFVATQFGCEKTEEEENVSIYSDKVQITIEDEHHDASPHSGKFSCISDNDSSPIRTMESGIQSCNSTIPASDQFSGTHGRPKVAETLSGEQDQRSSGSNEMKHECCYNREESAEVDDLIHIAAESLIHISLESSACYQESSTQAASNELENEDKEQPQRSIDSFELMTLEQAETGADEYSVTSKPFEVSDGQAKDFGIKLRRGRRLKDFQKDILPGLASLSRHEICEDKNILEGVLRSREYKKMRAKMAIGENWCTPVRSRQSRLNYVGRKTFR